MAGDRYRSFCGRHGRRGPGRNDRYGQLDRDGSGNDRQMNGVANLAWSGIGRIMVMPEVRAGICHEHCDGDDAEDDCAEAKRPFWRMRHAPFQQRFALPTELYN